MSTIPPCPKCHSEYVYLDAPLLVCPECAHEWEVNIADDADSKSQENHNFVKGRPW